MVKAYKLEVLIIDFDGLGEKGIREELTNIRFPNDCLNLDIKSVECRDIGEWDDNHPLNLMHTYEAAYQELFYGKSESDFDICPWCDSKRIQIPNPPKEDGWWNAYDPLNTRVQCSNPKCGKTAILTLAIWNRMMGKK